MPEFECLCDVSPSEFLNSCSSKEIKELIDYLITDGHLPKTTISNKGKKKNNSTIETDFFENLDKVKNKYYTITNEDLDILEKIFKKYI